MTGIVGILKLTDNPVNIENLLVEMSKAIKHEKWYKIDKFISDKIGLSRVSLGVLNPEPQPIFNEDSSLCIMMEGELYDYADLKKDLKSKGHKFSINNEPEFILHLYEEHGEEFANKLNGSFAIVIWNDKKHELLIINDRYGLRPLYYTNWADKLLFGSEVKAILADKTFNRNINDEAVSDFFSFGYLLGNKTFFEDINLLPAASILVCQNGQVSIRDYWNFDFKFKENYEEHSEDYYVKSLYRLWSQAVERRMKGNHRIGVLLSGGLDSRLVVGAINQKYFPIDTFTFGKPNCEDATFAQLISNRLGTQHHFFALTPDHLVFSAEKNVYLTDGMKNCTASHMTPGQYEMKDHSDIILSGLTGDLILGGNYITDQILSAQNINEVAKIVFDMINGPVTVEMASHFFSTDYYKKIEGKAFNSFIKEFKKTVINANHTDYFFIRNLARRFLTLGHVIANDQLEYRIPFCDIDFTDFVYTIPVKLRKDSYIYVKTFKEMFPQLAEIPYRPKDPSQSTYIQRIKRKLVRKINCVFEKMGYGTIIEYKREFHDYDNWMRKNKELKEYILRVLLDKKTLSRPYFNQEYVKKILDQHMSGKANNFQLIGLLLTFELWHRQFID